MPIRDLEIITEFSDFCLEFQNGFIFYFSHHILPHCYDTSLVSNAEETQISSSVLQAPGRPVQIDIFKWEVRTLIQA